MENKKHKDIIRIIRSIFKKDKEFIPLHEPVFTGNEKEYLNECIKSTMVSYVGEYVIKFEQAICEYTGAKYAAATVNGTTALQTALITAGVKTKTEVITQALTFAATANAITHAGGTPIFIDADIRTFGMSDKSLEIFLEENCIINENGKCINIKTKNEIAACVPVHIFGHPCRIDKISEICRKWNIPLIEDAAESLGSFYNQKHTGRFGKAGILSFNGNKIITTGGGGMIITDDEEFYLKAKYLTTTAKVKHPYEFIHDDIGFNFRMPNVNAAIGLGQMERIKYFIDNKRELYRIYKSHFDDMGIELGEEPQNTRANYWLNTIKFDNIQERDNFLEYSNKNGIGCRAVWKLMTDLEMYKNCIHDGLENSKYIYQRYANIPSSVRIG